MAQFYAHAGESYLIRIGSYPTFSADGDSFRIACRSYRFDYETLCNSDVNPVVFSSICESRSRWDALNSTRGQYRIVEDFVAEESGSINTICWAGTYLDNEDGKECIRYSDDDFEVTYFADDCGAPGAVMAHHPFSQEAGTLDVIGPAMTHVEFPNGGQEFEFSGEHASFEVTAGQTYWVRITNSAAGECGWYWETTPRAGYAIQIDESNQSSQPVHNDLAFCFDVRRIPADGCDVPVLPNDDCPSALPLVLGATEFNTATAITDGPEQYYGDSCYLPLGDRQIHKDIWFGLENPCSGKLELSLCQSDFDTKLAVYEDLDMDCNVLWFTSMKACSDDDCEPPSTLQSVISFDVSATVNYKIRIGGYENAWGQGRLVARYVPPVVASLRDFAAMSQCFTGSCTAPCIPLSLPACCFVQDIDADGDVDLDDAANLISVFTNPQP